ncbi:hypothetical protein A3D80_03265 [Candidatus Roizmanbacteria bacterium RIFCSPHIGHO2_02_FULL_40_13b]|uniref:Endolytic murein transglycosylase n=1 Tax=Candidatus Roizmanbacteria bacterium RIFCSPHIGHO2_01_FULL_39_24 TaxID=1802032 RepID=A0A1F7GLE0_9BACT|nr:MAG: hypothetical protein A2799_01010 [Candidatus Roizmanbacteria bacterium RIFCSPHIGHO2_01_FULL_39_24]OGK26987.1 MAG: hypothetical protein A3D80_03265 [Candidatus Roizmanbacteria bacterium RIFCSPHIGHO2_02_FULL_40_13b]OGK48858.1 MAG: hypothetical protein A3A56_01460 [Candidatus Roizmanbacteria bacterium RIFCSPLOWO2_01_FULL_40_32]OGK57167.1 MAG: hypothetical protein A3H83_00725 [Candidatus Roizmanbacteria bacterium RIFCSPLOWO2_02_FULL_39_8]
MRLKKSYIFICIFVIISIGFFLFYKEGSLPVNKTDKGTRLFVINRGDGLINITNRLDKEGLIRSKTVFYIITRLNGLENKIEAGDFRLSPSMTSEQIAKTLTKGTLDIWVTVIEGLRREEIADILSETHGIDKLEFMDKAVEGYLFPDTYLIPKDASVDMILSIFKNNFDSKYNGNIESLAQKKQLNRMQVITLASLVEKEARSFENRTIVASIMLKRYKNGWPLDLDATVQYALGYQSDSKTWWKKNLTREDIKINSLYNTYKNAGLPPGPICNPGLDSIKAVLAADEKTPYWFYISSRDGSVMHYAQTQEEHDENIRKYLN